MKKTRITAHFVAALFTLGAVSLASAYVLLSPNRRWYTVPTYIVDNRGQASITDSDGGATAVVNAITSNVAWNGAGSGTVVNAVKGSVAGWSLGDGIPMLNFRDPERVCNGSCLAATFTGFYRTNTGLQEIYDADIVTSASKKLKWVSTGEPDGCSGEYYIEGVMVHEVGHGLGLGHTTVTGATMYPSVSSCNNGPATTEADDEDGLNFLY